MPITYTDKDKGGSAPVNQWRDTDANEVKTVVNDLETAITSKADLVSGKVPSSQLPSSIDDVMEYINLAAFPVTGVSNTLYVAQDSNLTYRWTGSTYVSLGAAGGVALGETSSTAYRGDRGKTAFDHTTQTDNPHTVTKAQVGLSNVDDTADSAKPVSIAQQTVFDSKAEKPFAGAFTTAIPFNKPLSYLAADPLLITGNITLTVNTSGALLHHGAIRSFIADGTSTITLSGFKKSTGSGDYINTNGVVNHFLFWYTGAGYFYSIYQDAAVLDVTAPTLTSVTIASNNANTAKAKTGDVVKVTIVASEEIQNVSGTIAGNVATAVNTTGNTWELTVTMLIGNTEGTVAFNIVFEDLAGNDGTPVSSTTNSSAVVFDRTAPTVISATAIDANTIQIVYSEVVTDALLGHSFKKNAGALVASGVASLSGTTKNFTVPTMLNTDILLHSYNSGTGATIDAAGNEVVSFVDSAVTNSVGAALSAITFVGSNLNDAAGEWTKTGGGGWEGMGVGESLAASTSGHIQATRTDANSHTAFLAFTGTNTVETFSGFSAGPAAIYWNALGQLGKLDGAGFGAAGSIGITLAIGETAGIFRDGTTGVYTLKISTDGGLTWGSVVYTFTGTQTTEIWAKCSIDTGGTLSQPKKSY